MAVSRFHYFYLHMSLKCICMTIGVRNEDGFPIMGGYWYIGDSPLVGSLLQLLSKAIISNTGKRVCGLECHSSPDAKIKSDA